MRTWKNPIFVALDLADLEQAYALAARLQPWIGGVKLGLEFFCSQGPQGIERMRTLGLPLFLDLKLYDIPATVGKTIMVLKELGVVMTTVHCSGGLAMLTAAKQAAAEELLLLGVTVLTSMEQADLPSLGVTRSVAEHSKILAGLAREAGLGGLVCAATELHALKATYPQLQYVVPGIRPSGAASHDQKRIMAPAEALKAGADVLVIGRPITEAADPVKAAEAIARSL